MVRTGNFKRPANVANMKTGLGCMTGYKSILQTNLKVNWSEAICC